LQASDVTNQNAENSISSKQFSLINVIKSLEEVDERQVSNMSVFKKAKLRATRLSIAPA
jgi:hypothetical protein